MCFGGAFIVDFISNNVRLPPTLSSVCLELFLSEFKLFSVNRPTLESVKVTLKKEVRNDANFKFMTPADARKMELFLVLQRS